MRIIHLSCVAPPQTGGIGQVAFEEVKRLVARGEEAELIAPALKRPLAEVDASFIKRLPSTIRWGNAAALSGIADHLEQAEIVHLHYPFFGTAEQVSEFCLWRRKPLVMTFHMDAKGPFPFGMAFDLYRIFAQPAILRACAKILVSSFDYADASSIASFKRAHPDRVVELPFGVDDAFAPGASAAGAFGIPAGTRVIGFVGGMDHAHRFKGIFELLEAARDLPENVHLLLVGEGDQRRAYEARAKELGIAGRCHFHSRLSRQDLVNAYRSMDVFAFPSTSGAEAFGLVAAEAEACGIPVVASNLPGVRTVVRDNETGLLVPPKNVAALRAALAKILNDASLRSRLSSAAADHARVNYRWDAHVDRLLKIYAEAKESVALKTVK